VRVVASVTALCAAPAAAAAPAGCGDHSDVRCNAADGTRPRERYSE